MSVTDLLAPFRNLHKMPARARWDALAGDVPIILEKRGADSDRFARSWYEQPQPFPKLAMKFCALIPSLLALAPLASPQTVHRVHVKSEQPRDLRAALNSEGFDATIDGDGVLVFGGEGEFAALQRRGLTHSKPIAGRPLRTVLKEESAMRGVPVGYQDLASIEASLHQTAMDHPSICQVVDLSQEFGTPQTFEGRSLIALKISDNVAMDEDEPAVLVASTHHARELVPAVIALAAIERLTDGYGTAPAITAAIDEHEIWIVPVCNPDGYEYVFNTDDNWRKNRRVMAGGIGVDLNRNYPQGWDYACAGSTFESSIVYKGPSPASEPETQALIALGESRRLAKVVDYHSSGQEVLWGYACPDHPFDAYLQSEAAQLSTASGYAGAERKPSADGEAQQWHSGRRGAISMLVETALEFQPPYADAVAEAALAIDGIGWMLQREIPLSGHVTSACDGSPIEASIEVLGFTFPDGEENRSGGTFGRWHANLPPDTYAIRFTAPGFQDVTRTVTVGSGTATVLDVEMDGPGPGIYCSGNPNSTGLVGQISLIGSTSVAANDVTLRASDLPPGQTSILIYGMNEVEQPLLGGFLCVTGPLLRLGLSTSTALGDVLFPVDLTQPPVAAGQIEAGSTWNFQAVYRDPAAGAPGGNTTLALRVPFCP